jgi:hypothetical protein
VEMRVEEVPQAVYEPAESRVLVKSAPKRAVNLSRGSGQRIN